jgi:hypothetical protein
MKITTMLGTRIITSNKIRETRIIITPRKEAQISNGIYRLF